MKKTFRYFRLHVKTAFKNLIRHIGLATSAAFSVSLTLVLIALFALISSNLNGFTKHVEQQVTIRASIDNIVKADQKTGMLEEIKNMATVKTATLSTGTQELEAYKQEYADESNLFSMYDGDSSPIRDTFLIEVKEAKDLESVSTQIQKISGIVDVQYGGEATDNMIESFASIRDGSLIFIVFLVVVAVILISNKIKVSIYTRKHEIAVMRFIGSSNFNIKFPMMLEGITIGFFGSLLPILATIAGYYYFYDLMNGNIISMMFTMQPVFPLTLEIAGLLMGIGVSVGLVGSFFSTTRYLRWKR